MPNYLDDGPKPFMLPSDIMSTSNIEIYSDVHYEHTGDQ